MSGTWVRVARPERFELPTLWFEARCSIQLSYGRVLILPKFAGGAAEGEFLVAAHGMSFDGARNQARLPGRAMWKHRLATEKFKTAAENLVGLGRLELPTSPLSGVRSSHLSYRPNLLAGNILRDLPHSSNNGAGCVSLDYEEGLSGTGAIARKSSRKRSA